MDCYVSYYKNIKNVLAFPYSNKITFQHFLENIKNVNLFQNTKLKFIIYDN